MQDTIVDAELAGCRFLRLYLLGPDDVARLQQAVAAGYDYVFAYTLRDLGDLQGFSREQKWTQILSLTSTLDDLFAGLHKNNRYKIKRTYRDLNVQIAVDDPAHEMSYGFYKAVKEADGIVPDVKEDFNSIRWINAYHRGELVSSTSWFDSGQVLRAKHIVSTRKQEPADSSLIGRLTRRLFWEACVLGLEKEYRYIDLGGLDPSSPSKKGVADFKRSFGGNTSTIYVYRRTTGRWRVAMEHANRNQRTIV